MARDIARHFVVTKLPECALTNLLAGSLKGRTGFIANALPLHGLLSRASYLANAPFAGGGRQTSIRTTGFLLGRPLQVQARAHENLL